MVADFLLAAAGFVLATVALGLVRILRGPGDADRIMAAQLLGTGGIAALLLLAEAMSVPAAVDVALILALLAAFVSVAFVKGAHSLGGGRGMSLALDALDHSRGLAPAPSSSWQGPSVCCGFPTRSAACTR